MFVIRPIQKDDIDHLKDIAMSATLGLTSLPKNKEKLEEKLKHALKSFSTSITAPENELYLFLLEESETKEVGGSCGIISKIGVDTPSHFLKVETIRKRESEKIADLKILTPVSYIGGPTEVGSLFLKNTFRKEGLGKLLSFSRFLFIAAHRKRFESKTIAEMRGVIDKNFFSPLWNALGSHFFHSTFAEAMMLRDQGLFRMSDLIPDYPIYLNLLPKKAQNVIGKVHPNTKPALKMLKQMGFFLTDEIDYFDGGPKIEAATDEIKVIKESKQAKVSGIENIDVDSLAIIGTTNLNFRAIEAPIKIEKEGVVISEQAAKALQVEKNDRVIYYKLGRL